MKIIEVLYPEFSNIYAELYNIEYLKECNKNIKVIYTSYNEEPYFIKHKVDMVYIGSMPDSKIIPTIDKLKKYKENIKKMIEEEKIFLITGNALEIFSSSIKTDKTEVKGLGIFKYNIEKDLNNKHASWFLGNFKNIQIVGHRNQFSKCYNIKNNFIKVRGGFGSDLNSSFEGINYKNFYATYLLGPFLILNPYFTKYILNLLNLPDKLAYENEIINAYDSRIAHFNKEGVRFIMGQHG